MAHNIFQDKAFAYARAHGAAWHGLGEALDNPTVAALFAAAGIPAGAAIAPLLAVLNGIIREVPEQQVVYWTDQNGDPQDAAATVGADYTLFGPTEMLDLTQALVDASGAEPSTAGRIGRRGTILFTSARLASMGVAHDSSPVDLFLNVSTSVDGSMRTAISASLVRVVCQNTLGASLADAVMVRHTARHDDRVKAAIDAIATAKGFADKWAKDADVLARKRVGKDLAAKIVTDLYPGTSKRRENQREKIMAMFAGGAIGAEGTDSMTAWALLQALTEYDQKDSPVRVESGRSADALRLEHIVTGDAAVYADRVTAALLAA